MSKGGVGGGQQTPFGGQSQSFYHQRPPSFRSPGPIRPPYFRDPPVWGPPPFRPPMRSPGKGGQSPWSPATNPIFMPGSSYRQPWIPGGYGQMQYSPQRFSGYGALPDMSYPSPIRPRDRFAYNPPEDRAYLYGSTPPQQQQQAEAQAESQADQTEGQAGQTESQAGQTEQTAIPQNQTFQIPRYGVSSGSRYFNQVRPNYGNQFGNYSLGNYGQAIDLAANGGIVGIPRGRMR